MQKVSNHYVPQFYLKNFSTNRKSIGIYNLKNGKYVKEASIKKQACKDNLYGYDNKIEDMFMNIESLAAGVIREITEFQRIPSNESEEYQILLIFMLLSEARNLKTADSFNNLVDKQMKTILKMKIENQTLKEISPELIDQSDIKMDIPNLTSIKAVFDIYQILFDLKCCLIVNNTDRYFITSDNPLVRYNLMYIRKKYRLRGYGLGNMGIQLFYPITPRLCICIFDNVLYKHKEDEQGNIIVNKGRYIDELNKLIYLNSYETLFFNGNTPVTYIRRLVESSNHDSYGVEKEVTILGSKVNKLIQFSPKVVEESINLPMFGINLKLAEISLPYHMAGPLRPYAMRFVEKKKMDSNNPINKDILQ